MKNWLISIAAFSTLSAVADMLLPKSAVSRYAKLCISLLLTVILIKPVVGLYNKDFSIELPQMSVDTEQKDTTDRLTEMEFSHRFTDALQKDTGFDSINITADLGYDSVERVYITGADKDMQVTINKVLFEKYEIPAEKVEYGDY